VAPQTVTLIASIIALVGSLLTILLGTRLALLKERRQLLWSRELERFFALEERAGQLVEELASYRALDQSTIGPGLEEYRQAADMTMYAEPSYSFRTLSTGCSSQRDITTTTRRDFVLN
jgi:hypothetical protein